MGVDDKFQELPLRQIPRADVAEVCVQSVLLPESDNRFLGPSSLHVSLLPLQSGEVFKASVGKS